MFLKTNRRRFSALLLTTALGAAVAGPVLVDHSRARAEVLATKTVTIFDGTSLKGWRQAGPGRFDLHDGMATATGGMGLLWYDRQFGDFVVTAEFKTSAKEDNSGVFVRFPDPGNDPWVAVNQGHEIQICDTEDHNHTGAIYNFKDSTSHPTKPVGEWNTMSIKVVGRQYTVTLNGQVINEYTSTRGLRGYIGLQNHFNAVSFRKVTVEELPGGEPPASAGDPVSLTASTPGLVGEYFNDLPNFRALAEVRRQPFYVRVDPQIDFPSVTGDFYDTHLSENFGVRWTGAIKIEKPGAYLFALASDDGSKLQINGKTIVDNSVKGRPMIDRAGEVSFQTAGTYPVSLLFDQEGGGAGCILKWLPPGSKGLQLIPAGALVHEASAENVTWDKAEFAQFQADHKNYVKKHGKPYEKMDYGPSLAGTFKAPFPEKNVTLKGVIVGVDKDHEANILFDTEMMRYSAGWTGDLIDFHGVAYDGSHGVVPGIRGRQVFGSAVAPGWSHDGKMADARPTMYGNLPADQARYRGMYHNGQQTILSYTIDNVGILDLPGMQKQGETISFTRSLQIDPTDKPMTMLVATTDSKSPIAVDACAGVELNTKGDRIFAVFAPHAVATQYAVRITKGASSPPTVLTVPTIDYANLVKGGPALWGDPIPTQGKLGDPAGPYTVDTITIPESNPSNSWLRLSGFDFFPDGKSAAVCTWNGDVWIVKGIDDKLDHLTWKRYATGLFQSLGLKIVNGEIYVLGRDQITHLHDLNGDGEADFYENFNNDCEISSGFHEFEHDLQVDSKGYFYYAKGGPVNPGGRGFEDLTADAGCIMRVSPDGKTSEVFATGLRAPNGMSMGPQDQITVSDNQGTWTPACRISFVTKGSFLGVPTTSHLSPEPKNYGDPICWFPYIEGDYTHGDNSSGGAAWDVTDKWGPFDGQLIHLSYGTCSIFETMYEKTDGLWQGGVVRFPLDFESGVMRARFNTVDGQLYVCGLKGWQTHAAKDGAFQRVRYTGKTVYMPNSLHVRKDGLEIGFTQPVDKSIAADTDNYSLEQWNYIWSDAYGSPDVHRDNPKKKGHETVEVDSITVSADGKTVFIKIPDLKPVMQMKVTMKIKSADGTPMTWELDNTINVVPGQKPIATAQPQ